MRKPWKLIETDNPDQTLGQGRIRHYVSLIAATNALAKSTAPYVQVILDDGCEARELDDREQEFLEHALGMLGYDIDQAGD
jgi:hypothetical protein